MGVYLGSNKVAGGIPALDGIYPIGSIYMNINNINPSTLFGGTWEQLKDRFLLGVGDTYASGETGGEAEHILTEDEMPSHTHKPEPHRHRIGRDDTSAGSGSYTFAAGKVSGALAIGSSDSTYDFDDGTDQYTRYSTSTVLETGGGLAHNNMPPYLAVYIWKRTA